MKTGCLFYFYALQSTFIVKIQLGKISICFTKLSQSTNSISTCRLALNYLLVL